MRSRRGIALFAALMLMVLIALLVAGAVAASTAAQRSSRLSANDALLTASTDYALGTVLADARSFRLADLAMGQATALDLSASASGVTQVTVNATRLPGGVVWLVADATIAGGDQGHRRVNLVVRFPNLGAFPDAPIVARGDVHLGHDVVFQSDASGDGECARTPTLDVIVGPTSVVTGGDSSRVATRPMAMDVATYFLSASQLAALDTGGAVVHVRGDTTITGGAFDGILIVDGVLTIAGTFSATGIIVARDRIVTASSGFTLTGNILAFANPSNGDPAMEIFGATIRYSTCSAARALRHALQPHPVRQRSWAEMF
ncbi:MAG TPA: hypothetical protein VK636_00420 [Gemmatimonadaceae bacterium]|nr:hypothetical protein [Gemmatimonadaceae bacterium]